MKYQLVIHGLSEEVHEFDTIWDALKEAIRILEETERKIKGITCGEDLFHEPKYILRSGAINSIWFSFSNCPNGYWNE